jgi:hypothetical protein
VTGFPEIPTFNDELSGRAQFRCEPTWISVVPNSLGRRLAPHVTAALAVVVAGKPATQSEPGRWVTPLPMRIALLGDSVK